MQANSLMYLEKNNCILTRWKYHEVKKNRFNLVEYIWKIATDEKISKKWKFKKVNKNLNKCNKYVKWFKVSKKIKNYENKIISTRIRNYEKIDNTKWKIFT